MCFQKGEAMLQLGILHIFLYVTQRRIQRGLKVTADFLCHFPGFTLLSTFHVCY